MIKVENIVTPSNEQWERIIMGTRNPKNSWNLSDSDFSGKEVKLGDKDLRLMKILDKAGKDHRKFMRMIPVFMDVTSSFYWWKEADTYKIATVSNSCSTMHKITSSEITEENYSFDPEPDKPLTDLPTNDYVRILDIKNRAVADVEWLRKKYNETKHRPRYIVESILD